MHGRTDDNAIALARQLTGILRRREQTFGRGAVNELQWEMLLRLLVDGGADGCLPERGLLIGVGTASAEAGRLLDQLVDDGLVWRIGSCDSAEGRQIHMTGGTRARMMRVLGGVGTFADELRDGLRASVRPTVRPDLRILRADQKL
ncbi:MAG: hypothetical protein PGN09_01940 [Sphingomonas fennica]